MIIAADKTDKIPGSCDVIVAGGGMVGLAFAIAAARAGLRVSVIDTADAALVHDARFDGRVSAIAFASRRFLETIGAWAHMRADAQPILDIVVSDGTIADGASPLFLHFDHGEIGNEPLGHMVENRHIRIGLAKVASGIAGLTMLAPRRILAQEFDGAHATVTLDDGSRLVAPLVVGAEGRDSPLRGTMDVRMTAWSYNQHGIVTTVEHELPHEGTAQEFFLPSGPFAILPMTGNRSSLVWTEKSVLAPHFLALSDADFAHEVQIRFTDYLGAVRPVGPRFSYPLGLQLASHYVRERRAIIGDAAHVVHPIAGQGLNLGLRDAAALGEVIVDAVRLGLDIGSLAVLERYQSWRRFDTTAMAMVMDGLNRLFSNDIAPLRMLRDAGMALAGRIGPLRRFFMRHAGGDAVMTPDDLPRLLRGEAL